MELFIKVYETCPDCKGTGWIQEEKDGICYDGELCACCIEGDGKIERIIKLGELIDNVKDYLK